MKEENVNYYLIIEKQPFNYMTIDISLLDIGYKYDFTKIENIDTFTKAYTYEEIMNSIKRANIITEDYLEGKLHVIEVVNNNNKYLHKYEVLTEDLNMDIKVFIEKSIKNKNIMNSILQKYKNLIIDEDSINRFKKYIKEENTNKVLYELMEMPYISARQLFFYINEKLNLEKEKQKVLSLKNAA